MSACHQYLIYLSSTCIDYSLDDELFDWLKATSTSVRSVSHLRQNSHISFSRIPSNPTAAGGISSSSMNSMAFSRLSSNTAGRVSNSLKVGATAHMSVQDEAPSNEDWSNLMKRNRMAQADREAANGNK